MDDIPIRSKKIFTLILLLAISIPLIAGDDPVNTTGKYAFISDSTNLLILFSAKINKDDISLIWKVHEPLNISHFQIERSSPKSRTFESLRKIINKSDYIEKSQSKTDYIYSYTDEPNYDGVYYYRLNCYDNSNNLLWQSDEIKVGISGIKDFTLEQNQPNPFNPATTITYELQNETHVKLQVFDLIGKEIATLVDQRQGAGRYTVEFNISNYANITSGIYFYKLETDKYYDVKKMIISK